MTTQNSNRPNFILITTDQQRWDTIQALGNPFIHTPNLNHLCDFGMNFSRAYTDAPVCMPARATVMTGCHGYNQGLTDNSLGHDPIDSTKSLAGRLTQAGYQTRAIGKMHFPEFRKNYGFEHIELIDDYYRYMAKHPEKGVPMAHGLGQNQMEPCISTVDEVNSLTHWTIDRSIDFLETRDPSRPFMLWTSFTKPHPPFDPCRNYWELYRDRKVPDPVYGNWSQNADDVPSYLREPTFCLNNLDRLSPDTIQDIRRAYYALITQIDYSLGLLLSKLREQELLPNTWLIFTTDHGEFLGDHHLGAKTIPLEAAARIPFIIKPPAKELQPHYMEPGSSSDELVCLADILPTIMGAAGIEMEDQACDGLDISKMIAGQAKREELHLQCRDYYGLIRDHHKYLWESATGSELLFDVVNDPYEKNELIREGQTELAQSMKKRLAQGISLRGDACAKGETLTPFRPDDKNPAGLRGRWPGYHSSNYPCDVKH